MIYAINKPIPLEGEGGDFLLNEPMALSVLLAVRQYVRPASVDTLYEYFIKRTCTNPKHYTVEEFKILLGKLIAYNLLDIS